MGTYIDALIIPLGKRNSFIIRSQYKKGGKALNGNFHKYVHVLWRK
jgi:hypothetical protein